MNAALLDTSFLISLSDPARVHHGVALAYYKACIEHRVRMLLSTVVVSEFQVRQAVTDLPLRNFQVLPFNVDHAMACGLLARALARDAGDDRVRVKDDLKLIAQCPCEGVALLLTEDESTLTKYLQRATDDAAVGTRAVLLKRGFDAAWFEGGQARLLP